MIGRELGGLEPRQGARVERHAASRGHEHVGREHPAIRTLEAHEGAHVVGGRVREVDGEIEEGAGGALREIARGERSRMRALRELHRVRATVVVGIACAAVRPRRARGIEPEAPLPRVAEGVVIDVGIGRADAEDGAVEAHDVEFAVCIGFDAGDAAERRGAAELGGVLAQVTRRPLSAVGIDAQLDREHATADVVGEEIPADVRGIERQPPIHGAARNGVTEAAGHVEVRVLLDGRRGLAIRERQGRHARGRALEVAPAVIAASRPGQARN